MEGKVEITTLVFLGRVVAGEDLAQWGERVRPLGEITEQHHQERLRVAGVAVLRQPDLAALVAQVKAVR